MARKQSRPNSSRHEATVDQGARRWWLAPRLLYAALALATAAVIILAVALALGLKGSTSQSLTVVTCTGGTPGCALRSPSHSHANFAVIVRGEGIDFNKPRFLSTQNDDRSPLAHLHQPRFDVVHIHRTGTNWDEFFRSIGFELSDPSLVGTTADKTCFKYPDGQRLCNSATETFKFYVNGVKVVGISFTGIHELDRVLVSYGSETDTQVVQNQVIRVGDDACIPSERCPDRIPKNEPPEQCTISNDTCVKPGG